MSFDPMKCDLYLVETIEDASAFWRWITQGHRIMAFDTETSGLNWVDDKIRLAQFGTLNEGWAIPTHLYPGLVHEALVYLKSKGTIMVTHNGPGFDYTWQRHVSGFEPDWAMVHDSMILAALVDSAGSKALKDLSAVYVHPIAKIGQQMLEDDKKRYGFTWATVPYNLPSYWQYGVLDTILTANLFVTLLPIAERVGVMDAYNTERHVAKVLHQVSYNGMLLDQDHARTQMALLEQRIEEIRLKVWDEFGLENIGSGPQLAQAFINTNVRLTRRTESGNAWSMDQDSLDIIHVENPDHPLVGLVTEFRQAQKYKGYYKGFLTYVRSDGRCHPYYRQLQARTLRMSANDPPIQTVPRPDDPFKANVRNSFIASPGNVLLSADQSNCEARIFACLAPDPGMQQAFRDGIDLHCYTGGLMYNGGVILDKKDPRRPKAKNSLFTALFGGGADVLAVTAGIPVSEAEDTLRLLKSTFPSIKTMAKDRTTEAAMAQNDTGRAGIRLMDGRLLRCREDDDRLYQFANYSIQGTARMILGQRLCAMDNAGIADRIVAVVHDECIWDIPADEVEDYQVAIKEYMTDDTSLTLPIPVGIGNPCHRWGEADH